MLQTKRGNVPQKGEGIEELIPEKFLERRGYQRTTLQISEKSLTGKVSILDEDETTENSKREREGLVLLTDGLSSENELVGCVVVWKEEV